MAEIYPNDYGNTILYAYQPGNKFQYYDRESQLILNVILNNNDCLSIAQYSGVLPEAFTMLDYLGALLAIGSTNNPQWGNLFYPSPVGVEILTGSGFKEDHPIGEVVLTLIQADSGTDYWWGTQNFAKFGFIAFETNPVELPVTWINFANSYIYDFNGSHDGYTYGMYYDTSFAAVSYSGLKSANVTYQGDFWAAPD